MILSGVDMVKEAQQVEAVGNATVKSNVSAALTKLVLVQRNLPSHSIGAWDPHALLHGMVRGGLP